METLLQTIMRRDNLTENEANEVINEVREIMQDAVDQGNFMEAEEIFMQELGLEADYIIDLYY
jgi:nucleoid DNA-binding protein